MMWLLPCVLLFGPTQASPRALVSPAVATIRVVADGQGARVFVTNRLDVAIDAWEFSVFAITDTQPNLEARIRHDFYRSALMPPLQAKNFALQPHEEREERISIPGLISVKSATLLLVIRRDGSSEGDLESIGELRDRRSGDASELAFWIGVLDGLAGQTVSAAKASVRAQQNARAQSTPKWNVSREFAKSLDNQVAAALSLGDDSFPAAVSGLLERYRMLYQAATNK